MANLLKTIIFLAIVGAIAMVVAQMYFGNFLNPQGGFCELRSRHNLEKTGSLATAGTSLNRLTF